MRYLFSYLSLLIFLVILFLHSCKRDTSSFDCNPRKTYYYLDESDKAKVPYTGKDTLIFISHTNDTAICIGQGKNQFFFEYFYYSNPDCPPWSNFYEAFDYKFISNNLKFQLELKIYKNDGYGGEIIHILKNNENFQIYLIDIDNLNAYNHFDSINVRNLWIKNISWSYLYNNPKLSKVFYNSKLGILKIQNADSTEVWDLYVK